MLEGEYPIRLDIMLIAAIQHSMNHRGVIARVRKALRKIRFSIELETIPVNGETISQEELIVSNDLQRNKIETIEHHPKII